MQFATVDPPADRLRRYVQLVGYFCNRRQAGKSGGGFGHVLFRLCRGADGRCLHRLARRLARQCSGKHHERVPAGHSRAAWNRLRAPAAAVMWTGSGQLGRHDTLAGAKNLRRVGRVDLEYRTRM